MLRPHTPQRPRDRLNRGGLRIFCRGRCGSCLNGGRCRGRGCFDLLWSSIGRRKTKTLGQNRNGPVRVVLREVVLETVAQSQRRGIVGREFEALQTATYHAFFCHLFEEVSPGARVARGFLPSCGDLVEIHHFEIAEARVQSEQRIGPDNGPSVERLWRVLEVVVSKRGAAGVHNFVALANDIRHDVHDFSGPLGQHEQTAIVDHHVCFVRPAAVFVPARDHVRFAGVHVQTKVHDPHDGLDERARRALRKVRVGLLAVT